MADDNEEEAEPAVELGDGEPVEGAPLVRIASRLHWPVQKSEILRKESEETTVRTPDGPRELGDLLERVDESYFQSRQEFLELVRDVTGTGPIPTADE
ncbi:DUF5789 family protein [Halorussus sp. MSC15.2]|uniref:DUF5789 family protein n=1 Tax=Halorussus sp. MSC15.2 TaxID=2283638 RepID=UPI0013D427CA|nr:DUF5789 family protein [Halorussus sp. MSC15.2]NEU57556.1 hypothetical protein [Halorussus sp. MSC15.2]